MKLSETSKIKDYKEKLKVIGIMFNLDKALVGMEKQDGS